MGSEPPTMGYNNGNCFDMRGGEFLQTISFIAGDTDKRELA